MTITAAFCPQSLQSVLDANGIPIIGARLLAFDAATTTPRPLYKDAGLTQPYQTPILTDGYGRFPAMFVGTGPYKIVLQDNGGALIGQADGLPGGTVNPDTGTTASVTIPTGFIMGSYSGSALDGWVIANGKTIGSADSGASSRADDNAQALYVLLWSNDPTLVVQSGRGLSGSADFAAGKTIALPDFRGRALFGRDTMGGGAPAGLITAISTGQPNNHGAVFGLEAVTLGTNMLPAHSHGVGATIGLAGGHTHAASTDNQGLHNHTGTTDVTGDHVHSYQVPSPLTPNAASGGSQNVGNYAAQTTASAGNHQHNVTVGNAGAHTHNVTVTGVGDHVHSLNVTENQVGTGAAHFNMPPGILVTWFIKL